MRFVTILVAGFLLVAGQLGATPITFTGSSGSRVAQATFDVSGTSLVVTLTNLSPADAMEPSDVLTAVFFHATGVGGSLVQVSAVVGPGGYVTDFSPYIGSGGVVGGEWAYQTGFSAGGFSGLWGLSSVGLGIFGPGDRFPGPNLQGPDSPDGVQFGIVSFADNPLTGNGGINGQGKIVNSVVLTLSGLPQGFDPSVSIHDVLFQYGTSLCEGGCIPGDPTPKIPEPGTFVLLGGSLIGLFFLKRRLA